LEPAQLADVQLNPMSLEQILDANGVRLLQAYSHSEVPFLPYPNTLR
jgi:hypothetical protein